MNDVNPFDSPRTPSRPDKEPNHNVIPQLFVRIVLGILGAFFIAPAFWVMLMMFTGQHALAELSVYPAMIGGGIMVSWTSFSRSVLLRVLAWSVAGFGAGMVLDAILTGGLAVGTFITLSGIVLGVGGAVFGIRARPRNAQ